MQWPVAVMTFKRLHYPNSYNRGGGLPLFFFHTVVPSVSFLVKWTRSLLRHTVECVRGPFNKRTSAIKSIFRRSLSTTTWSTTCQWPDPSWYACAIRGSRKRYWNASSGRRRTRTKRWPCPRSRRPPTVCTSTARWFIGVPRRCRGRAKCCATRLTCPGKWSTFPNWPNCARAWRHVVCCSDGPNTFVAYEWMNEWREIRFVSACVFSEKVGGLLCVCVRLCANVALLKTFIVVIYLWSTHNRIELIQSHYK